MTFELIEILRSKHAYRRQLAAQPLAEKLRLLDQLRERSLAIANVRTVSISTATNQIPARFTGRN